MTERMAYRIAEVAALIGLDAETMWLVTSASGEPLGMADTVGHRVSVSDCAFCGLTMLEPGRSDYPGMEVGIHEACFGALTVDRLAAALAAVFESHYREYYGEDPREDAEALRDQLRQGPR